MFIWEADARRHLSFLADRRGLEDAVGSRVQHDRVSNMRACALGNDEKERQLVEISEVIRRARYWSDQLATRL